MSDLQLIKDINNRRKERTLTIEEKKGH